jgi:hypothetical protein
MSEKMTCPGCNAYTSDTRNDYMNGDPCRFCGLPNEAMVAVISVQRSRADETLKKEYAKAIERATRAEDEVAKLSAKLEEIRYALLGDE